MDLFSSPPPLAPPTKEEDKLSWLRLLRSRRVGPQTFRRLMTETGWDAAAAIEALRRVAFDAGVSDYKPCRHEDAAREYYAGLDAGAVPIFVGAAEYPSGLASIDDAPPLLWAIGSPSLTANEPIAVVGARNASSLGLRMARTLSRELGGSGSTIVSGLARGIDAVAHDEALATGTVAVVAGGVDVVYPRENTALMERIAEDGLLVSEQPPGLQPQARHFPRRNRIISGLSRAVVVVEAALRSGSLITARTALEQGRDVMAVPGHPFDPRASGSNLLIRDGAILVRNAEDVLDALSPIAEPPEAPARDDATRL
ncbi:MAG: DNA-processing protein DprA, partial [Planctomycetota bacterium]